MNLNWNTSTIVLHGDLTRFPVYSNLERFHTWIVLLVICGIDLIQIRRNTQINNLSYLPKFRQKSYKGQGQSQPCGFPSAQSGS
jgi:hypothetical protein